MAPKSEVNKVVDATAPFDVNARTAKAIYYGPHEPLGRGKTRPLVTVLAACLSGNAKIRHTDTSHSTTGVQQFA